MRNNLRKAVPLSSTRMGESDFLMRPWLEPHTQLFEEPEIRMSGVSEISAVINQGNSK